MDKSTFERVNELSEYLTVAASNGASDEVNKILEAKDKLTFNNSVCELLETGKAVRTRELTEVVDYLALAEFNPTYFLSLCKLKTKFPLHQ